MSGFESLRQWMYPREYRIAPYPESSTLSEFKDIQKTLVSLLEEQSMEPENSSIDPDFLKKQHKLLADTATAIWRAERKMMDSETGRPHNDMRIPHRHVTSAMDTLKEGGVDVIDHTGQPYDNGLALKVLTFQPLPDIKKEEIIETIKPTIYFGDEMIQRGEVIVGRPSETQ